MALTAEQKAARSNRIGSSDAPAILGLDRFRGAGDVYLDKRGELNDWDGNIATRRGTYLEPAILNWFDDTMGRKCVRDVMLLHPKHPDWKCANLDGCFHLGDAPTCDTITELVEVKTTIDDENWGEEGTDEVPERVLIQTAHQFSHAPNANICWVPVLMAKFGRFEWKLYSVGRNNDLVGAVDEETTKFIRDHVLTGTPPNEFSVSLEVAERIRRIPKKKIEVPAVVMSEWRRLKDACDAAEKDADQAKAALLAAMGDAEAAECAFGSITYFEQGRKGLDGKRLAMEMPDVAAKYATESRFRVMRFKAVKVEAPKVRSVEEAVGVGV